MKDVLARVVAGESLSGAQAAAAVGAIMDGQATPAQIGAFLAALRTRGEDAQEIAGGAEAMRARMVRVRHEFPLVADTCGTGGDGRGTFNFSTLAALVVAACGVPVAKHGNRAASSHCGSADLLEALGLRLDLPVERVEECLRCHRFAFLYAPLFHPAMGQAAPVRRELGFRTIFNLLGPLTNPAGACVQLVGVFSPAYLEPVARALARFGVEAWVVHGAGTDELTPCGRNDVRVVRRGRVRREVLGAREFGLRRARWRDLAGGTPEENAELAREVLAGRTGAVAETTAMNAAAALLVAGAVGSLREGVQRARAALRSGAAQRLLEAVVEFGR